MLRFERTAGQIDNSLLGCNGIICAGAFCAPRSRAAASFWGWKGITC